jgi:hypothetical protein
MHISFRRLFNGVSLLCALSFSSPALARIEIFLMGQTVGLKPPPIKNGIWFKGTPFGHMALYIESATCDDEKIIRQCRKGEAGGLVLTVDRQLKNQFFTATPRVEFLYGGLDPGNLPQFVTREDIEKDLVRFSQKYGHLYDTGPHMSGLGQDYGTLYIRDIWGLVYPTTKEEEAKVIEFWQQHRHDSFYRMQNNCVTTIIGSLRHAGLERRTFFIRGLAPYNAWTFLVKNFLWSRPRSRAPNGNSLLRDEAYLTHYTQIPSDAVYRSGRPFNVYCLKNLAYVMWAGPRASLPLPSNEPISYAHYPNGKERATGKCNHDSPARRGFDFYLWWHVTQSEEFVRLWVQSFKGLWFIVTG